MIEEEWISISRWVYQSTLCAFSADIDWGQQRLLCSRWIEDTCIRSSSCRIT